MKNLLDKRVLVWYNIGMAGKNQTCPLCSHKIKRPDGFLTKWQNKSAHIGCVEQTVKANKITQKLLKGS